MADVLKQAGELRKIWSAFQSSRVLITANNYRVFDFLTSPCSAGKLSEILKTDRRGTEIVLDALTGMGLLKKHKGAYKNTATASRFLVSGKPLYQGDIIRHAESLWSSWSSLDAVLRTGSPSRGKRDHESFILGMHNLAALKAGSIIKEADMTGVARALDLGGGPGTYSIEMAAKGIHVTLFDTPETVKIARKVIRSSGVLRGTIAFREGDFMHDDTGNGYDLVLISQIVHSYSEKEIVLLLKKCRNSLKKNGRVVIQEFLISEDRTRPVWSALFSVNMYVNTDGGRTYSPGEIKSWLLRAGFRGIKKKIVAEGVLVSGKR